MQEMENKETERKTTGAGLALDIELGLDMVPGLGTTSSDATVEVPARPKRRKAPRQEGVDALNGCLCGEVLQPLSNGVLKCKQAGCETQWVVFIVIILNYSLLTHDYNLVSSPMCIIGDNTLPLGL